jgi:hypothetical protein
VATNALGLFVERGGGGPAATALGSGGLIGDEGILESPLETDGRRRRDVGVEGGFASEGEGEEARDTDGGIASRVGMFWGMDGLGCCAKRSSRR